MTGDKSFGILEAFDPVEGTAILEPDAPGPGNWVGSPSVLFDPVRESVLLAYRRRHPRGEPDERGYECCVAESRDGIHFTDIWSLSKSRLETRSMERFNLHCDPDGRYLLYLSYEDPADSRWRIDVVEARSPDAFDVGSARGVLTAAATGTAAVKDPYVLRVGPGYYMYVSTFLSDEGPAPTSLAVSLDGVRFTWLGEVFSVGSGWDRYQARLSGILRSDPVFVGFYDGSAGPHEDTEERLGVALSFDLLYWQRLSLSEPWIVSPHASGSLRYLDGIQLDGEWWLYYEYARADGSHELRLSRVPAGR